MSNVSIESLKAAYNADFETGKLYRKDGREVGSLCSVGKKSYHRISHEGKNLYVHRVIYALAHGYFPKVIDHISGDCTFNGIANLVGYDDQGANMRNRKANRNESEWGRGIIVHNDKKTGKPRYYAVTVMLNGVRHYKSFKVGDPDALLQAQIWNLNKRLELGYSDLHCESLIKAIQNNPGYESWNPIEKQF